MSDLPPLALVTGGHRRLGARIAMRFAQAGYALAIHGRHDAEPHPFLAEVLAGTGVQWHGFVADFLVAEEVQGLMPQIVARFGRAPDLLVNSASLFGQDRLDTVTPGDLADHFTVNAAAPALLTQAFARAERREGRKAAIVNLLDQRLAQPHGDQLAYTMSKYALEGFTRITARELAPHVRVNAVAPGLTLVTEDYAEAQIDRLAAAMPLAAMPGTDDVADAVLYLAEASAVTGQILYVDGGAHMRSFSRDFIHLD